MTFTRRPLAVVAGLICLAAVNCRAATEGMLGFSGGIGGYVNGTGGWTFQVQTDVAVTSLGCYDFLFSNNPQPIQVGLWAPDGTLLATRAISSSDTLFDQSRYQSIAPVTLVPDNIYHLGAYSPSGTIILAGVAPSEGGSVTMASPILLRGYALISPGFGPPNEDVRGGAGTALVAPNFQFTVVPEPAHLAVMGICGLVVLAAKRRAGQCGKA